MLAASRASCTCTPLTACATRSRRQRSCTSRLSGRNSKSRSITRAMRSVSAVLSPNPFRSRGRVEAFQSSPRICEVKQSRAPCATSARSAPLIVGSWGSSLLLIRNRMLVSSIHAGASVISRDPDTGSRGHPSSVVILIQALAREGLVGQHRNLMRELRHFPEGVFKPILAQLVRASGKKDSLFEQARGIRLHRAAVGGSLAGELGLNLRCDVNRDRHMPPYQAMPYPSLLRFRPSQK